MDKLHVDVFGAGDSAIFVHGSFGWGLDTFPEQRALSDEYRIILVDRRGFAGSSSLEAMGWPADMHDVAALLDEVGPAHLVGQSYGAVVALLAAGLRPRLVRSLVAIEPPAFEVAQGDPDADATTASLKPVFRRAAEMTADEFVAEWARSSGMPGERLTSWTDSFGDQEWTAPDASRRERWPGDAPLQFEVLAAASFPKGREIRFLSWLCVEPDDQACSHHDMLLPQLCFAEIGIRRSVAAVSRLRRRDGAGGARFGPGRDRGSGSGRRSRVRAARFRSGGRCRASCGR